MSNHLAQPQYIMGRQAHLVGNSQFDIRVRRIGNRRKFVVDVFEFAFGEPQFKDKAAQLANNAILKYGVTSTDNTVLVDGYSTERKATNADGSMQLVKIRMHSFAYQGIE